MTKAGIPEEFRQVKKKPSIAIKEIDRIAAAGVQFGCVLQMLAMVCQPRSGRP